VQTILYKPDIHAKLYVEILELLDRKLHVENPDLTLKELAKLLGSNEMYVSQAINQVSGKNFNKFINGYRIEEAKKILLDPNQTKLSMEEVAAMSGFTSVNTFYRQFKDQTGLTPSQYKRLN
jgi:YesN/AraC family two-component response regulator